MAEGSNKLDISCPICFEDYYTPKVLACGHTFCCQCLGKILDKQPSTLQCPKCRRESPLSKSGKVEDLPTNFALMTIIDDQDKEKTENISKNADTAPTSQSPCPLHKTPTKFYCKSCKKHVCAECLHDNHKPNKHEIISKTVTSSYFAEKLFVEVGKLEVKLQHYSALYNRKENSQGEASCKLGDKKSEDVKSLKEKQENFRKAIQKMLSELVQNTQACEDTFVDLHKEKENLSTLSSLMNKRCTLLELKFRNMSSTQDCKFEEIFKSTEALKADVKSLITTCYKIPTEVDIKFLETFQRCLENITKTARIKPVSQESAACSSTKNTEETPRRNDAVQNHVFYDFGYFYSDSEDDDYYQDESKNKSEAQGNYGNSINKGNDRWDNNNGNDNTDDNNGEDEDEDEDETETYYDDGWGFEEGYESSSGGKVVAEDERQDLSDKGSECDGDYTDDYEDSYEDCGSDREWEHESEFQGDDGVDNSNDYEGTYGGELDQEDGFDSELGEDYGGEVGEFKGDNEGDSYDSYEDEYDGEPDECNGDNGCDPDGDNSDNEGGCESDCDYYHDDEYQGEVCECNEDNGNENLAGGEPGDVNGDPEYGDVHEGAYGDEVEGEQDFGGDNGCVEEGNVELQEFEFDYAEGYVDDEGGEYGGDIEYGYHGDQGDGYGDYYGDDYEYDYDY